MIDYKRSTYIMLIKYNISSINDFVKIFNGLLLMLFLNTYILSLKLFLRSILFLTFTTNVLKSDALIH